MKLRLALLASVALLAAGLPTATAQALDAPAAAACLDAASAPPCGYIVPQLTLDFPQKPLCRAESLGGPIDLSKCLALPPVGQPVVQEGVLRFSWDITQDGTYPPDAACAQSTATGGTEGCIVITFSGTATNPKWVDVAIEPEQIVLDMTQMASQDNIQVNPDTQQVMFSLERPVKVTFTRDAVGDDEKSVQRIERAQGVAQVFLKAKSSASGQYYKEAFGVEEFRFDSCRNGDALAQAVAACTASADASKDAPGLAPAGLMALLAALAVALRRRD